MAEFTDARFFKVVVWELIMSLINKMLNDLEKRDAFLNENQDTILDGLYSAYDLEVEQKRKSYSSSVIFVTLFTLLSIAAVLYYSLPFNFHIESEQPFIIKSEYFENETVLNEENTEVKIESSASEDNVNKNKSTQFLKLDDSLLIKAPVSNNEPTVSSSLNRIEGVYFETNQNGINLVMKMPNDIDYLVYGLKNPNRIVIEVNNAELGFLLEELQAVEPIVAIRYSINEENRFKLVLETEQQLTIRKTTSIRDNGTNDLVVFMDYEWPNNIAHENNEEILTNELYDIVDKQVELEKETVYKGELVKTPVTQDINAYAEKLFRQAYKDYKNGNISQSLKRLNMALDQDSSHVNARSTLATILSKQGHIELAYSILNEGLIQYPEKIEWVTVYARLLLNEGKVVEASELIAKHSPELSVNVDYYALKAAILQKLNEHNESAKIYRDLLQFNPLNSTWWMGLGISLESLKRYADALYAYQKASNNSSLVGESKNFINQRITMLSNLLKDESS